MLTISSMTFVVHTQEWEEHLVVLQELFQRLSDAKLTARPTKCVIGSNQIEVVAGRHVMRGVKGLHEDNVKKIPDANRPNTMKEVWAFIGLTSFYREFIPN